ncbi:carbohydrate ABC transporter permease [Chelatococcus asaccharovorans]|uniref:carbohydrate ABC transporter permease n=1 Tax=Chelatococcus asaccharovorans TaxID=28210 RepID=UPI00224C7A98|nr:carbohydrate ABC transporter permease [Chelatococcus asaccharovorans]CAH1670890.1 Carbohydrate ABC transporter membrane protein 2 (CUT1 family) [Chelatococcus asaccharovorans]CAH1677691.1 Carbohydrate ABC transporter membrane protein 2 (CUT1 family) [Chelatococcus asaccharovorans]
MRSFVNSARTMGAVSAAGSARLAFLRSAAAFAFTLLCAGLVIFPYYWMFVSSLGSSSLFEWPPRIIPSSISFKAYEKIFTERAVLTWLTNTAVVASATSIFCTIVAINAGYALSRFRGKMTGAFGIFILFSQMLPATLIVVPLYVIFRQLGLYNTLIGLAIADAAFILPLATWLMKGFFDRIPVDLEEQAQIDGCSRMGAFYRVTLPLAIPGLVVVTAFSFITGWDEFFLARTLIATQSNWVLSVGLTSFESQYSVAWDEMMAASVVFALPAAAFFLVIQRYLVSGLTSGAVKG